MYHWYKVPKNSKKPSSRAAKTDGKPQPAEEKEPRRQQKSTVFHPTGVDKRRLARYNSPYAARRTIYCARLNK